MLQIDYHSSPNEASSTTENNNTSSMRSQSEGARLGVQHSRASSEHTSIDDLEAQVDGESAANCNMLPAFFQRFGRRHYAGIAIVLLVLHIVRSAYSGFPPDAHGVSCSHGTHGVYLTQYYSRAHLES